MHVVRKWYTQTKFSQLLINSITIMKEICLFPETKFDKNRRHRAKPKQGRVTVNQQWTCGVIIRFLNLSEKMKSFLQDQPVIVHHGIRPVQLSFSGDPKLVYRL